MSLRKNALQLLILILFSGNLLAQDSNIIDSLTKQIPLAKTDSAKAAILESIGKKYNLAGNQEGTLRIALQTVELYKKMGNVSKEADQMDNIAGSYYYMMNRKKAVEYWEKAKELRENSGNEKELSKSYANLGTIYRELGNTDKALDYDLKALAIFQKYKQQMYIGMMYNNLGLLYDQLEDYKKAREYFQQSLDIKTEMNDSVGLAATYGNIGMSDGKSGNYKEAIEVLEKSLAIATAKELPQKIMNAHENLSGVYYNMGNFEKAYDELGIYASLRDSLITLKSSEQINELQAKYDADKREHDISDLKQKSADSFLLAEKQKLYFIIAFVSGLLLLSILLLIVVRNKSRKKQQETELAKNKAEFEQKALRAQMNPHFIFNALNSIQHYILSNETQYAYDYLAKFSKLIRQVLVNSEHATISLKKEIELLTLYIELEQRRFKNRFEYKISYDDSLQLDEIVIPVMLIQPFVENAIWHGIMNLDETRNGNLKLNIELQKEILKITIEDNGVGREQAGKLKTDSEHESVGMLFTRKRLEILKSINDNDTKIVLTDLKSPNGKPEGTRVELFLISNN
jgi:tetratricopeptide (TPR) repeat protein